jgi:hypothetical protein
VERADGKGGEEDTPETYLKTAVLYVEEQYAGAKENLRPIYDELLKLGKAVGDDMKVCPCKTMVPLYREHVFAQIKPTTNTRIDLGFALTHYKGKLPKRLIDTGGQAKKDRIRHRIPLQSVNEIDGEVRKWLETAYDSTRKNESSPGKKETCGVSGGEERRPRMAVPQETLTNRLRR